jgi:hypothetical protein
MRLLEKPISLIRFHETIWEMYKICEEFYYHYTGRPNDQNKSCSSSKIIKPCS